MGIGVSVEQLGHACFELLDLFDQRLDDVKVRGDYGGSGSGIGSGGAFGCFGEVCKQDRC